ncbi:hypothetical protein NX722_04605 [Endozoicomonas gorgoniicola]|uniref:Uncharacterized protein n=1 Tax=Endozoicomonas gorgoniicola TaxID=1234144 RepID=A0ABT3MRD2_9GAMM|nr:hypothetical protein [Endozoicomonas gorgoniicola]MCW7551930.1 hypothetical protein [Endozoicomonas gorgoniicola]
MHTPKVLPVFAAFFVFILNAAYGGDLTGKVEDKEVVSLVPGDYGSIKVLSVYHPPSSEPTPPDTPSGTFPEQEQTVVENEESLDETDKKPSEDSSEDTSAQSAAESQEKKEPTEDPEPQSSTTTPETPEAVSSNAQPLLDFYGNLDHLSIRSVPGSPHLMSIHNDQNTSSNTVYLSVDDSREDQSGPGNENSAEPFFNRVENYVSGSDQSDKNKEAARTLITALTTPAFILPLQEMAQLGTVQWYNLCTNRVGTAIRRVLGQYINRFSGYTVITTEIRVPTPNQGYTYDRGSDSHTASESGDGIEVSYSSSQPKENYHKVKFTLALPGSYDAHTLGAVTPTCSDGKKDITKKEDDDDNTDESKSRWRIFYYPMKFLSLFTGTAKKQSDQQSPKTTGNGKQGSMLAENSIPLLLKQLLNNRYDTSYPHEEDSSLLTLKHNVETTKWINQGLKIQSANGLKSGLNPANQANQGIMGY